MGTPGGYAALNAAMKNSANDAYTYITTNPRQANPDLLDLAQTFLNNYLNDGYRPPPLPSGRNLEDTLLRWLGRIVSSYEHFLNHSVTANPDPQIWALISQNDPLQGQGLLYLDSLLQLACWDHSRAELPAALRPQFVAGNNATQYFQAYLTSIAGV
jgi:hypothetical protein